MIWLKGLKQTTFKYTPNNPKSRDIREKGNLIIIIIITLIIIKKKMREREEGKNNKRHTQ